jgi:hypothetical protein
MRIAGPSLLGALAALAAACAEAPPAPISTTAATASAGSAAPAAAPAPSGPVTRFDGRYAGPLTLNPDRTRACPAAPTGDREITVRNGRATLLLNPRVQQVQTGTVGADGSVRMTDSLDRTIATAGIFTESGFQGEYRNGLCSYAVLMPKRSKITAHTSTLFQNQIHHHLNHHCILELSECWED